MTLQEMQANLAELVHRLGPGEDLTITENDRPIARLIPVPRGPGSAWPGRVLP